MMIRVYEPVLGKEEIGNVVSCMERGLISGSIKGDFIQSLEEKVSKECDRKFGIATTSGTTALALAIASLGLGPGDEVIVPATTNIATAFAVVYLGAKPVFVDSEKLTWNMDPSKLIDKINKRTKVILPVHLYGHPADMDRINSIAKDYDLVVIEDAAEAQGGEYKGRKVGSLGDHACFSFYANKIVTTGEGGMVVTDDEEFAEKCRLLKNLAYSKKGKFIHEHIGFNYRMTNLQAAIGVAQIERLEEIVKMKRQVARWYTERLESIEGLTLPAEMPWAKNVYWMYGVVLGEKMPDRDLVISRLEKHEVETRPFFYPMNKQPVFLRMGICSGESLPVSEWLGERGFYLPSSPLLKEDQIEYICRVVRKCIR